jgi:carboxyl-terminal processing protease
MSRPAALSIFFGQLVLGLSLTPNIALSATGTQPVFSDPKSNLDAAIETILAEHVDPGLTRESLYEAALRGVLESLNRRNGEWHSLLRPGDVSAIRNQLSGQTAGVGVTLESRASGAIRISGVVDGSPAQRAGIRVDDTIVSVNGRDIKGMELAPVVALIRGSPGETVELETARGSDARALNRMTSLLKREKLALKPVSFRKLDHRRGLLTIQSFTSETPGLVESELRRFLEARLSRLVIDLRDNAGGSFLAAVQTTEHFLPSESVVAQLQSRDLGPQLIRTQRAGLAAQIPLILISNTKTSSGAELMISALQDVRRAQLVGTRTLGKWDAQSIDELPNQFAIKYTVQRFQSPKGRSAQGSGLAPDVRVDGPGGPVLTSLRSTDDLRQRLNRDAPLARAFELIGGEIQ